ncbi:MAG: exodeoxyribonuclease VII small subunit [Pseudomonadota bacterium]
MDTEKLSFEQAMQELEKLVAEMEQGEITLEQSLAHFERGITLARHSQHLLTKAEQKVQMLTSDQGQDTLMDFQQADSE